MKGSKNTSAPEATSSAAGSSSAASNRRSPAIDGFALDGVSTFPDPATNAYRKDLADVGLAGRVIASHYAEPLVRHLVTSAPMMAGPDSNAPRIAELGQGDAIRMLDMSLGWAWGYGPDGRVGYVPAEAVGV